MPNWIGSMPSCFTIGRKIGVRMIVEEMLSTKQPMMRKMMFMKSSTRNLLCAYPKMNPPILIGILSIAR